MNVFAFPSAGAIADIAHDVRFWIQATAAIFPAIVICEPFAAAVPAINPRPVVIEIVIWVPHLLSDMKFISHRSQLLPRRPYVIASGLADAARPLAAPLEQSSDVFV
jgi:hypothetical protein